MKRLRIFIQDAFMSIFTLPEFKGRPIKKSSKGEDIISTIQRAARAKACLFSIDGSWLNRLMQGCLQFELSERTAHKVFDEIPERLCFAFFNISSVCFDVSDPEVA